MKADTRILDDQEAIAAIDKESELKVINSYAERLQSHINGLPSFKGEGAEKIIITGMGGSAITGDYLQNWLSDSLDTPMYVWRDYGLPNFVDNKTLVLAVSYSGNTEETISAAKMALAKGATVVGISSGGTLTQLLKSNSLPIYPVPKGLQPRAALPFLLSSAAKALFEQWIIGRKEWSEVTAIPSYVHETLLSVGPSVPLEKNESKQLASEIFGKMPVIYGYDKYQCVARRFKTQINENAKAPAKFEFFPELDHNEIEGWDGKDEILKQFYLILIRDDDWKSPYKERISITMDEIKGNAGGYHELIGKGGDNLQKILDATLKGDLSSVYLAVLRGVDPSPVTMIESLKKKLANIGR